MRYVLLFVWIFFTPLMAFPFTVNIDSIYNEHKLKINNDADSIAKYLSDSISSKYYVPNSKSHQLYNFLRKREVLKACYDFSSLSSESCLLRKKIVDEEYQDSIYTILIPNPSNKVAGYNISLTLLYEKQLHLSSDQYNELMSEAIKITKLKAVNSVEKLWEQEMTTIHEVLDKTQWDEFFRVRNESIVLFLLNGVLNKLRNHSGNKLSQNDIALVYAYLHERQKITDIFKFRKTEQQKALKHLRERLSEISDIIEPILNDYGK